MGDQAIEDGHVWRIRATAARIEMLQEDGLTWDEIDDPPRPQRSRRRDRGTGARRRTRHRSCATLRCLLASRIHEAACRIRCISGDLSSSALPRLRSAVLSSGRSPSIDPTDESSMSAQPRPGSGGPGGAPDCPGDMHASSVLPAAQVSVRQPWTTASTWRSCRSTTARSRLVMTGRLLHLPQTPTLLPMVSDRARTATVRVAPESALRPQRAFIEHDDDRLAGPEARRDPLRAVPGARRRLSSSTRASPP